MSNTKPAGKQPQEAGVIKEHKRHAGDTAAMQDTATATAADMLPGQASHCRKLCLQHSTQQSRKQKAHAYTAMHDTGTAAAASLHNLLAANSYGLLHRQQI
jgi:hypothetical protein